MSENISISLQIMGIGMGLVFAAILVLWVVMALIVQLTGSKSSADEELIIISAPETNVAQNYPEMAAAAAVAVLFAIKRDKTLPHPYPLPPTPIVSAWQAVLRSRIITKRGRR